MPHIRIPRFWHWIIIHVDDAVEVKRNDFCNIVQFLEVIRRWGRFEVDEGRQGKRSEVADCYFIGGGIFDDFGAQVGGFDGTEVLLVGFGCDALSLAPVNISIMEES